MIRPAPRSIAVRAADAAARSVPGQAGTVAACALGAMGAAALGAFVAVAGSSSYAVVVEAAVFTVAVMLSVRFRWFAIVALWLTLASVSSLQLSSSSTHLAGPVGPADALVGLVALGWAWRTLTVESRERFPLASAGWIALLLCALFDVLLGWAHGFDGRDVLVGVRVVLYLAIGYGAARSLADAYGEARAVARLLWVVLLVYVAAQVAATNTTLGHYQALGGQLQNFRDIGSPFFAGKYGLILAAVMVMDARGRAWWLAFVLLVAGLGAVLISLVRTDWLAAAIGLGVAAVMARRGRGLKLAGALAAITPVGLLVLLALPPGSLLLNAAQSRLGLLLGGSPASTDTVAIRLRESQAALSGLRSPTDWLFGRGFGYVQPGGTYPFQHDSFVWLLTTQGILGLTLFLVVVLGVPLVVAVRRSRRLQGLPASLVTVLVAAQVANIAEGFVSGHLTFGLYTAVIGITVAWLEQLGAEPAPAMDTPAGATISEAGVAG